MQKPLRSELIHQKFNLCLSQNQHETFVKFRKSFLEFNKHTNLISKNDEELFYEKHVFDSLSLSLFFDKYDISGKIRILDIGTGGGFPSLPLSIAFPKFNVVAVDSIRKKIDFVNMVKNELSIKNITPICKRVEDSVDLKKESFDVVTTRALADLRVILEYGLPFVKKGGYFVAFKSQKIDEEIENAKNAIKVLGGEIVDKIPYSLPIAKSIERYLLVIKKVKTSPKAFPRIHGQAKKNPL